MGNPGGIFFFFNSRRLRLVTHVACCIKRQFENLPLEGGNRIEFKPTEFYVNSRAGKRSVNKRKVLKF